MVRAAQPESFSATDHAAVSHTAAYLATDAVETAKIKDANVTDAKLITQLAQTKMNSAGHIFLAPENYSSIGQGTWAINVDSSAPRCMEFDNLAAMANGDNFSLKMFLSKGTYSMRIVYVKISTSGIFDVDIDGDELVSVDAYDSGTVYGAVSTTTGITIAASGIKTLTVTLDGKNASSSNYRCSINEIVLWRTA